MRHADPLRLAALALLGALVPLVAAVGASADPSVKDKRAQARAIVAEIQSIDEEVGAAAERWNGANIELESLTSELADTRRDLARAREHFRVAQARAAERLRDLYVNGAPDSALEVLLGARSLDDVIATLDAAQRIASQDARIVREARSLRSEVVERERPLEEAREEQAVVVERLAAEKRTIESRLAERRRLLASIEGEIARLEEIERRRQAELRRAAQRELEKQRREAERAQAQGAAESTTSSAAPSSATGGAVIVTQDTPELAPPPADASKGAQVVAIALQYLGVPYKWGGASPETGFDCSGLTMYVFAQVGVSLPHFAAAQYRLGYAVPKDQLEPGDLVFFRALGHMGMYIGGGNFIHAPRTGDVVKISSLSEPYYVANWVGARRVL
jgi:cell wall-associated NlpC family hydrolase